MDLLTPERMCIILKSKDYKPICDNEEQWFNTHYHTEGKLWQLIALEVVMTIIFLKSVLVKLRFPKLNF